MRDLLACAPIMVAGGETGDSKRRLEGTGASEGLQLVARAPVSSVAAKCDVYW